MIYEWSVPDNYPQKAIAEYDGSVSPDYFDYVLGKPVELPVNPFIFEVEVGMEQIQCYDCVGNNTGLPLVGPRMQDFLDEFCPGDIQYLPAKIHCLDGIVESYKAINITHSVDAIDYEQSDYKTIQFDGEPEVIINIRHLVFHTSVGEHNLMRDRRFSASHLVSQKFYDAIKQHNFTGIRLITADDINRVIG